MAKKVVIRTREEDTIIEDKNLQVSEALYIPYNIETTPEKPGAIRFNDEKLQSWNGTEWKSSGGLSAEDLGAGVIVSEEKLTLDLESKTLVSPLIIPSWTIYKNDGTTPYQTATSGQKNIVVDKGCVVDLSAYYSYPAPNSSQAQPNTVAGNFPGPLPAAGVDSQTLIVNDIVANASYGVTLSKPKSGLIVVNNQVQFASGNDSTSDAISVAFKVRSVFLNSTNAVLTANQIETALNGASFADSKAKSTTANVTGNSYLYYLLDSDLGQPTSVIQGGTDQVFTAFQFLSPITITNAAGASRQIIVMRSNVTDAFSNISLAFS